MLLNLTYKELVKSLNSFSLDPNNKCPSCVNARKTIKYITANPARSLAHLARVEDS